MNLYIRYPFCSLTRTFARPVGPGERAMAGSSSRQRVHIFPDGQIWMNAAGRQYRLGWLFWLE